MADVVKPADCSTIAPAQLQIFNRNQEESPLLRLPPELRNHIWEYVFTNTEFLLDYKLTYREYPMYSICHKWLPLEPPPYHPTMGVLYTCRQMYKETSLLPTQLSTFATWWPDVKRNSERDLFRKYPHPFHILLDCMTEPQLGAVRLININVEGDMKNFLACMHKLGKGHSAEPDVSYNFSIALLTGLQQVSVWISDPRYRWSGDVEHQNADMAESVKRGIKRLGAHKDVRVLVKLGNPPVEVK